MSDKRIQMPLEEIIGDHFGRYSKYIIQERALPDIRDGLKPVQRRIFYSMFKDGNTLYKRFRKSARVSVETLWVISTLTVIPLFMTLWCDYHRIGKCVYP